MTRSPLPRRSWTGWRRAGWPWPTAPRPSSTSGWPGLPAPSPGRRTSSGGRSPTATPPASPPRPRAGQGHPGRSTRIAGVTELADGRKAHGRSLLDVPSPWLFPGLRPGSALTEDALAQRLHAIGISPRQGRSTALLTLAAEVPAAILAKTLGIHVQVAIQWQKISAGDWTAYAADVSRRTAPQPVPSHHETRGHA
jgi:hypothetical protein